jgi:hypothetical protein
MIYATRQIEMPQPVGTLRRQVMMAPLLGPLEWSH